MQHEDNIEYTNCECHDIYNFGQHMHRLDDVVEYTNAYIVVSTQHSPHMTMTTRRRQLQLPYIAS